MKDIRQERVKEEKKKSIVFNLISWTVRPQGSVSLNNSIVKGVRGHPAPSLISTLPYILPYQRLLL
jgi:hypothetical protein